MLRSRRGGCSIGYISAKLKHDPHLAYFCTVKLVTFLHHEPYSDADESRLGIVVGDEVIDLEHASGATHTPLPSDIITLLRLGEPAMSAARKLEETAKSDPHAFRDRNARLKLSGVKLLAPVPRPT